jgi:hypothetical protein
MTIDVRLSRTIAAAVMDRIERDRNICSEALTETIHGKLAFARDNAKERAVSERSPADEHALNCALELVKALGREPGLQSPSGRLTEAYYNATQALSAAGKS